MQSQSATVAEEVTEEQYTSTRGVMNGSHLLNTTQSVFPGVPGGQGMNKITVEQVDPATLEDSDDSEDGLAASVIGIKPGKKTKGRVKIKMEFIENKLRRYTTFSKRKTGIMKKAYELSTLTGTQVMLLVASETGHVYTFATRKLQPMITSESGKALIQTCLNSPDPPPGSHQAIEQRMNPTGFEETELSYAVSEEENKMESAMKPVLAVASLPPVLPENTILTSNPSQNNSQALLQSSMAQPVQAGSFQVTNQTSVPSTSTTTQSKPVSMSMQLPGLPPGTVLVPPGTPLIPIQQNGQHITNNQQNTAQTVYRIPNTNQLVSIPGGGATSQQELGTEGGLQTSNVTTVTSNQATTGNSQSSAAITPGVMMYQTPQGIVYAPTTATLQDRQVLNFQQQALTVPSQADGGQQIITIPVPVSLTGSPQVLQFTTTTSDSNANQMTLSQPSAPKKSRK